MINTVWETEVWQLDMQLIGKVALTATAVFILSLAYRFYKLRKLEGTGPNGKLDPVCGAEQSTTEEAPLQHYIDDETCNLRFRCVHNNLQSSSVTEHENKNLAEESVTARQDREGFLTDEVTCKHQSGLKSNQLHEDDPLQSQPQLRDDTSSQDECDGEKAITKTQSQDYRQDPEGGEMHEKLELANGSLGQVAQNFPPSHENPEEKRLQNISTKMQEEISTDGGPMKTCMTGALGDKMVKLSSQLVIDDDEHVLDTEVHGAKSHLTDLPPSTKKDINITSQQEPTNVDEDYTKDKTLQETIEKHNAFRDNQEREDNDTETQDIQPNITSCMAAPSSFSIQRDQDVNKVVQLGPNDYHISLDEETMSDVHLDLGNCYDVLCMAKKHKLNILMAAAYKIMSDDYLQVLQNPAVYGRLNATERDQILEERMKGKRFVVVADIDTQIDNALENNSSLSYYDSDNNQWHVLSTIPSVAVSRGCSMATLFNYIFIILGSDGLERQMKPSKRVFCYNPLTDSWKEMASLKEARPHCKLVALDGYLYAIGGECLHTVEKYDPRQNRWSYIAPLPNDTFAVAHMGTAYDDEIYVTGGTIRYMLLRYNNREKIWKKCLIGGSKDRTTEIVAANSFLYRFDLNRNMGISVHRCNIRARIWYECATHAMPYPSPFQCVVIDNNIYCISRNFHLRFLADEVSPRFMDVDLHTVPLPKGILYPLVLVLPVKGIQ
ncbi:kelch domain-containing protein 7A [Ranitomeya variabilis]|uniref:kelch domain-containing protein 7A n=1 Tax=Ranitomeya variabilis TaxID=490064 RepID=UPI004056E73A